MYSRNSHGRGWFAAACTYVDVGMDVCVYGAGGLAVWEGVAVQYVLCSFLLWVSFLGLRVLVVSIFGSGGMVMLVSCMLL